MAGEGREAQEATPGCVVTIYLSVDSQPHAVHASSRPQQPPQPQGTPYRHWSGTRNTHCPSLHVVRPGSHATVQPPQCALSLRGSPQRPPHRRYGALHDLHAPLTQYCPVEQRPPQDPQFVESLRRSAHSWRQLAPPHAITQEVVPGLQSHRPLIHTSPNPQRLPQRPQLSESLDRQVHAPPHKRIPATHSQLPD